MNIKHSVTHSNHLACRCLENFTVDLVNQTS